MVDGWVGGVWGGSVCGGWLVVVERWRGVCRVCVFVGCGSKLGRTVHGTGLGDKGYMENGLCRSGEPLLSSPPLPRASPGKEVASCASQSHATPIPSSYQTHASPMAYSCQPHAILMPHPCSLCVTPMPPTRNPLVGSCATRMLVRAQAERADQCALGGAGNRPCLKAGTAHQQEVIV